MTLLDPNEELEALLYRPGLVELRCGCVLDIYKTWIRTFERLCPEADEMLDYYDRFHECEAYAGEFVYECPDEYTYVEDHFLGNLTAGRIRDYRNHARLR